MAPEVPRRCPCASRCGLRLGNLRRHLHLEVSNRGGECGGNGFVAATELEWQRGRRRSGSATRAPSRTSIRPHAIAFSGRNSPKKGVINSSIQRFSARKLFRLVGIAWLGVCPAGRVRPAGFAQLEDFAQLDSPSWKVSPDWSCPVGGFHPAEGLFFQGTRGPWASNATFVQAAGKHLVRTSQDPRHAGGVLALWSEGCRKCARRVISFRRAILYYIDKWNGPAPRRSVGYDERLRWRNS